MCYNITYQYYLAHTYPLFERAHVLQYYLSILSGLYESSLRKSSCVTILLINTIWLIRILSLKELMCYNITYQYYLAYTNPLFERPHVLKVLDLYSITWRGVKMAMGFRGMPVEAGRQCVKDRKEWRPLVHL